LHTGTMRTLQIGDDWLEERDGGLGRYYFEMLCHLPATGATTHGLVVGSPWVTESTGGKVVAFARPNDSMLKRLTAARQAALGQIDCSSIDLIASHFALYAVPIADRLRTIPTVVHFHGPWSGESGAEGAASLNARLKGAVEKIVYSRAKRFIVLSHSFQHELVRRYGIAEELIRIVPGGIDIERFHTKLSRAEARERLGWPTDRPILLTVRRHVRRMGLEDLIEATQQLVRQQPDLLVLLGGSGPISGELKTRVTESGLEDHVRFLGRIDDADLPMAYRAADMSVVPSQSLEGFGLITLESLASGTPVFVTPVGGLPEIVQPFAPQCVFPGSSSAEIAGVLGEALHGTLSMPTEEACRAYAADSFSWTRIAERVRSVYDEAML
jgi:glycogen(starch) synthase